MIKLRDAENCALGIIHIVELLMELVTYLTVFL